MRTYIQINPADNVVVAVKNLQTGVSLDINGRTIVVLQDIPAGHKVALQDFKEGDHVIKYGAPIGHAREVITTGSWVNEKNIKTNLEGLREYEFNPQPIPEQPSGKSLSFKGYRRKNGEVGIRNEIWVIPTVGCVNGITHRLADRLRQETQGTGVDAIVAFPHNYGCSQPEDFTGHGSASECRCSSRCRVRLRKQPSRCFSGNAWQLRYRTHPLYGNAKSG